MDKTRFTSRPAHHKDASDLAWLHYISHTLSFQTFAARQWIKSRKFQEYQEFWELFLPELTDQEITWTIWREECLVGTVTIKELRNSSQIFRPNKVPDLLLDKACCLRLMYVHPDFLREGIGGELMGSARSFMEDCDYQLGILITHAANGRARGFYEGKGWLLEEIFRDQVKEFFEEPEEMQARARYYLDLAGGSLSSQTEE